MFLVDTYQLRMEAGWARHIPLCLDMVRGKIVHQSGVVSSQSPLSTFQMDTSQGEIFKSLDNIQS